MGLLTFHIDALRSYNVGKATQEADLSLENKEVRARILLV